MSPQNKSNKSICYFTYINLTISSFGSIYRAYTNDDIRTIVFIVFVISGFLVSEICMNALSQLPQNEDSPKKFLLKATIWVLVSSILFAFAFQFKTFLTLTGALIIFGTVISGSAFLFYVFFIYGAKKTSVNTDKSTQDDHRDDKLATSILEKV